MLVLILYIGHEDHLQYFHFCTFNIYICAFLYIVCEKSFHLFAFDVHNICLWQNHFYLSVLCCDLMMFLSML